MPIYDQYGNVVRAQVLTQRLAEPGMTGVRNAWAGTVAAGLTPQRLASILQSCDAGEIEDFVVLAQEMEERDPHYQSVLGMRKRVVSSVRPTVKPASDSAADKKLAEMVEEHIAEHEGLPGLIEDMLDALGKGFSVTEIVWEKTSSIWKPECFEHVDPRFIRFDRETGREMRLRDMEDVTNGIALAAYKFIRHTAELKSGHAFRGGLARLVAFSWMCKAYGVKDWVAFAETYGMPLRLGRYGPEATAQDVQKLFQAVASIGTDAAAVLPKSMEIVFENGPTSNGDKVFENLARWTDEQISKAVLGQTMTSDNGSSQSQATVHNEVRHDIAAFDARVVTATLNRDLVRPFIIWNFGAQAAYPRLMLEVAEPEDTKLLIEGATALMSQGVTFKASELRAKLGFSDPKEGDEIVGGKPAAPTPPDPGKLALNRAEAPPVDPLDAIEADMLSDWEVVADDMQAAVATAIEDATSYDDVLARLPEALRHMPTAIVVDTLVKGMFKARAVGDVQDG